MGIHEEIKALSEQSKDHKILCQDDYDRAGGMLIVIKNLQKNIKSLFEDQIENAKRTYNGLRDTQKELLAPTEEAEALLKSKIAIYTEEQEAEQRKRIEEIRKENPGISLQTIKPKTKGVSSYQVKVWEILDQSLIPDKYFQRVLNEKLIGFEVKEGKQIPGISIFEKTIVRGSV